MQIQFVSSCHDSHLLPVKGLTQQARKELDDTRTCGQCGMLCKVKLQHVEASSLREYDDNR